MARHFGLGFDPSWQDLSDYDERWQSRHRAGNAGRWFAASVMLLARLAGLWLR